MQYIFQLFINLALHPSSKRGKEQILYKIIFSVLLVRFELKDNLMSRRWITTPFRCEALLVLIKGMIGILVRRTRIPLKHLQLGSMRPVIARAITCHQNRRFGLGFD